MYFSTGEAILKMKNPGKEDEKCEAMTLWLLDKLWIKSIIKDKLGIDEKKILFCEHHLAYAASAFLCSPFEEAEILTHGRGRGVDDHGPWGGPRHRDPPRSGNEIPPFARRNEHYTDVTASIQRATKEILLKMAHHLHRETGFKKLCIAGGVGLNSVANGRILRETPFS